MKLPQTSTPTAAAGETQVSVAVGAECSQSKEHVRAAETDDVAIGKKKKRKNKGGEQYPSDAVAVIGMACRFPGANDYEEFWGNMRAGRSSVGEIPADRWNAAEYYSPNLEDQNKSVSKWGGFIDGVDQFDAAFFKISPREAELMDPQQRIMLELTWSCMEDAGYNASQLRGSATGVYIGVCNFDYKELLQKTLPSIEGHLSTGTYTTLIPNRISYEFDFKGPSIPIDTACSSSLVALHDAVHALQRGDCTSAFVGGVSVLCSPTYFVAFSKTGMLSPEGACKTFDDGANGYVRGEGAGMVLLKPLAKAIEDHDRIYGVIRGTSVNHGGRVPTLTSPNPYAQSKLIVDAYQRAALSPETVSYIEVHGTGTPKGDPIEVNALKRAFSALGKTFGVALPERSCGIGSVKTNIGHLEAAAGIAGVIKVLLSMRHRTLPGLLHFKKLNSRISLEGSPFYVVDKPQEWQIPEKQRLRRAGVSSFGFGGVNAHTILEEYREAEAEPIVASAPVVCVISAKNDERLRAYAQRLFEHLSAKREEDLSLASIAHTLQRREPMEERAALFVCSVADLKEKLQHLAQGATATTDIYRGSVVQGSDAMRAILTDAEKKKSLEHWMAERNVREIARLWVDGMPVSWEFLHENGSDRPRRMGLPTYPFSRKRHWVGKTTARQQPPVLPTVTKSETSLPDESQAKLWEIAAQWEPTSLQGNSLGVPESAHSRTLVLCALEPSSVSVLSNLLPPNQCVVLPLPDKFTSGQSWIDAYWDSMEAIKQAVKIHSPVRCLLLSNSSHDFCAVQYAALQSMHKEFDLPVQWYSWSETLQHAPEPLFRAVLNSAGSRPSAVGARRLKMEEGQLVFEEQRWACKPFPAPSTRPRIAPGGVYWITGGNGGIGRKIASFLAHEYNATVILSGRSPKSTMEEANLDVSGTTGRAGSIFYRTADCTSRDDMLALLSWIYTTFGKLTGVIHAAGAIKDKSVFFKTKEDVSLVMRPKIEGALILDDITKERALDCFIVFSSISGIFGNPGQTDYAAANSFLKQFAAQRQRRVESGERSGKSIAIHWPYWENGGMQLQDPQIEWLKQSLGTLPLTDSDGLAVFDQLFQGADTDTCFTYGVLSSVSAAINENTRTNMKSPPEAEMPVESAPVPVTRENVIQRLRQILSEITQIDVDQISPDAHFTDYGVDSILLQSFVKRVNDAHALALTTIEFHNAPTLRELSNVVLRQGPGAGAPPVRMTPVARSVELRGDDASKDDIAIVGANLRLPGAESLEEFWGLLMAGPGSASAYPEERWNQLPKELTQKKRREDYLGFFLEDILGFDHQLFRTAPREAMLMDPQQRLLLQSVWRAIESAGYSKSEFATKRTSVLLSIDTIDYEDIVAFDDRIDEFTGSGTSRYIAANRLSYFFDLRGVSEPVDTACSSFFVGLDRAVDAIRKGHSEQAIVAAVQLNISPNRFHVLKEKGLLSRRGRTLPFDQDADGFVRSEGVGAVILKPLKQAEQDRDHIYAVLKGVGVWHAGKSMGVTSPNSSAHQEAMKQALKKSSVSIDRIAYLEAHGTGMSLGDASEVDAFTRVFEELKRDPAKKCIMSAAKSTLGHLEAASGMAALMKVVLSLQKGQVPGVAGFKQLHSQIHTDWLQISDRPQPLLAADELGTLPHCAGLHSYGLGGVSAFVVLEAYKPSLVHARAPRHSSIELFVVSAQSESVLGVYLDKILRFLNTDPEGESIDFEQLVSTFQRHREHMDCRVAIIAANVQDLAAKIAKIRNRESVSGVYLSNYSHGRELSSASDVARCVAEKNWEAVASAWVAGVVIQWPVIEHARHPFPEYPFDTARKFWISRKQTKSAPACVPLILST